MLKAASACTIVCIQCGYKIMGRHVRRGRECPVCKVPMYVDGGDTADFRICRHPDPKPLPEPSLFSEKRAYERMCNTALTCGLVAGMVFVGTILFAICHIWLV